MTDVGDPAFWLQSSTSSFLFYSIQGAILLLLLLLSALISGSEVALFSIDAETLEKCSNSKDPQENAVAKLLQKPRLLLASILIANNLINIGIVTLTTFITWDIFGKGTTGWTVLLFDTVLVTFLIVFFGEVIPKVYATQKSLDFAKGTAFILRFISFIFHPLSFLLVKSTRFIEKRIKKKEYTISVNDLHQAVDLTTEHNTSEEKDILKGIVNFGNLTVKQVMRSRMDIVTVDQKINFHKLMDKINKFGFSRIPVYKSTVDQITGILYIKDVLPFINQDENFKWQKLLRKPFFIPESKKIDDLLQNFQDKHVHIAIVADEYGGTSGLITLEDILEEIVGEISDEFDDEEIEYTTIDENTFIFEGKTSLTDLLRIVHESPNAFDEVKGESESLGGLLLEINSGMPKVGETVEFQDYSFTIESANTKRIKRIKIKINRTNEDKV